MEAIVEAYVEVGDDVWSMRVFSSGDCDSFFSDDIFLRKHEAGAKSVFICGIVGVCIIL